MTLLINTISYCSQSGTGWNFSVDNITERVTREANIADARLQRVMGDMQVGLNQDVLVAEAQARIKARKAKTKSEG